MKNYRLLSLAVLTALTACVSTPQSQPEPKEEVYRPVEEVWPDVVAKPAQKTTVKSSKTTTAKNASLPNKSSYAQRRVVQI